MKDKTKTWNSNPAPRTSCISTEYEHVPQYHARVACTYRIVCVFSNPVEPCSTSYYGWLWAHRPWRSSFPHLPSLFCF